MSATQSAVGNGHSALRLTVATVTQYLAARKRLNTHRKRRVVLLRAVPEWDGPDELSWGTEQRARIVPAPSPLAIHELVLDHLGPEADGPEVLVVLTDREENELDPAILARVHRQRVEIVDNWNLVLETFGAGQLDPRLREEGWAAEALLDATPPGGWPQLGGGFLSRRTALSFLALRRLRLGRYATDEADSEERGSDGLDTHALLRWSLDPGGPGRLPALRRPEREGLIAFLSEAEQAGPAGRVLFALVEADHGPDAVPFGLLCATLWLDAPADTHTYLARGRIERWLGDPLPATGEALDTYLGRFGRSCQEFVTTLLAVGRGNGSETARDARRVTDRVLGRASELARQFGIEAQAGYSTLLAEGLNERFTALGRALRADDLDAVLAGLAALGGHELAAGEDARVRIERARMAARLVHWLAGDPVADVPTVAAGIDRHVSETGWADQALDHIEAGGDPDPALKSAYDVIGERVRDVRKRIDLSFAQVLETWTAAGTDPGAMLTVETFLPRVVKPVVTAKPPRRVLLLVLDGLSAGIGAELAEELRRNWAEYDPVPADASGRPPRRRAMAAALPTLTAVSRTSLFAATLMKGGQDDEKRLFPRHKFWGSASAAVFHKDDLRGETAGSPFGQAMIDALDDETAHIAVVLNTVDDRLAKEQKLGDATWRPEHIGELRELLREAAERGMAVVMTSDHGHVVDRRGTKVDAAQVGSARHRLPSGAVAPGEVGLSGVRVVQDAPGGRIVALWDRDLRYTAQKAGYHGGAALAEFTIPVLAFLPFRAVPPKGWRELGDQRPVWWRLERPQPARETEPSPTEAAGVVEAPAPEIAVKPSSNALFEIEVARDEPRDVPESEAVLAAGDLASALLESDVFRQQLELVARKPPLDKIEAAVRALLDSGTLPYTALAQRAGYTMKRADGFAAVLAQVLNYDGVQVLETLPDGRTLRLHIGLLREQFDMPPWSA